MRETKNSTIKKFVQDSKQKLKANPYKLKTNPIQTHCNQNKGQKEQPPLSTNPTAHTKINN